MTSLLSAADRCARPPRPHRWIRGRPAGALVLAALALVISAASASAALQPIDPGPFRLVDDGSWGAKEAVADELARSLPTVGVAGVLANGNRVVRPLTPGGPLAAVDGVVAGFRWNAEDDATAAWYPQGISGSADASADGSWAGHRVLAVSWYSTGAAGVRLTLGNADDLAGMTYRHVLLVDPLRRGGLPDFAAVPVHAGGIAWYGRYLYVVDTQRGLRVFDMDRIMEVDSEVQGIGRDAGGHYRAFGARYVLPQVGAYTQPPGTGLRFSFVSVDRGSTPHSLITGEYVEGAPGGRVLRWPIGPDGRLGAAVGASQALVSDLGSMQGAVSVDGSYVLSASRGDNAAGVLGSAVPGGPIGQRGWAVGAEDLSFSAATRRLYSLSEHPGRRTVFAIELAPAADTAAPVLLARLTVAPRRVARRRPARLSLTLSEAGAATVLVERRRAGRRVGGRCRRPRPRWRKRRPCARYVVRAKVQARVVAGPNTIALPTGRLRPGRYRVTALVRDAAGNATAPARVRLRVRR